MQNIIKEDSSVRRKDEGDGVRKKQRAMVKVVETVAVSEKVWDGN